MANASNVVETSTSFRKRESLSLCGFGLALPSDEKVFL